MYSLKTGLLDPGFLVQNMFTHHWIKLLDRHFFSHGALVLGRGVEVTSISRGNQLDFVSHDNFLSEVCLDVFAACTEIGKDIFNAFFVNHTQSGAGNAKLYPAILAFHPESTVMQIGQKLAFGLVMSVGNVVTGDGAFSGYLTYSSHGRLP